MQHVIVTGASGFVGGHIVRALAQRGIRVTATGRNPIALAAHSKYATCTPLDLSKDALGSLLDNADAIVHCAALSSPWGRESDFLSANVTATERLLAAALAAGVQRFVHLSSPSIYFDFIDRLDIREHFIPQERVNAYARTKWLAELAVQRAFAAGLPTVTLRPRAIFGEGDAAIMPRILSVAEHGSFPLFGGGHALIDVTYVGNVVHAVLLALEAKHDCCGHSFNITDGISLTVRELLDAIFQSLQLRVRLRYVPRSLALSVAALVEAKARFSSQQSEPRFTRYGVGVLSYSQTLNIDAARLQLGYQPVWTTQIGIQRYASSRQHAAH
jgi:nucleoside-diphosphate-sugar epimerase